MPAIPRLIPLEPIPIQVEGQQLVVLRDPMHFITETISVAVPVYLLLCLIDGQRSVFEIQEAYKEQFGGEVTAHEIEQLVADLDKQGLLQNKNFEELREKTLQDFSQQPLRDAAFAGAAYENDPAALLEQIDAFYQKAQDESESKNTEESGKTEPGTSEPTALTEAAPLAIIAPHIDPTIGGACAARAFSALAQAPGPPPDLFVLIGTAHQPGNSLFILTEKPFVTPLGTVQTDLEVARALTEACPLDLKRDEYLHKYEHSLEFQILFLQHLYGDHAAAAHPKHEFKILPILVGSFHEYIDTNTPPSTDATMESFTRALRQALEDSGKRVCFVVGADLSHMGKKFGDPEGPSEKLLQSTRDSDLEMLSHIQTMQKEDFFRHLQNTGDQQKVCGLPPIYTMMNLLDGNCSGQLLHYDLNIEEPTESFVSFASMAIYPNEGSPSANA